MKTCSLIIVAVMVLGGGDDRKKDEALSDKEKLSGTWKLISAKINGEDKTADLTKHEFVAVIAGDQITMGGQGDMRTSPLVIDATTTPKQFDILISLGIYELKDGELKVCLGGRTRPTEFSSKPDSEQVLFVFKRVKDKPAGKKPA